MLKCLQDRNGKTSHKRLIAFSSFVLASLIGVFTVVRAIYHPIGDPSFVKDFIWGCYGLTAALSGSSVFEKFKALKK